MALYKSDKVRLHNGSVVYRCEVPHPPQPQIMTQILLGIARRNDLTNRQKEACYHWLVLGKLNKQAAMSMGCSQRTVENHHRAIHKRLGTADATQVLRVLLGYRAVDPLIEASLMWN